jgi:hypothetical protein
MTPELLGRREDQRLEFKSREALRDPSSIAREVVGMLNAAGGEVWIGVVDEEAKAVALDPVASPERARDRLRDHLTDTIEPSPLPEEVSIELVPPDADPALLAVQVRAPAPRAGRLPFAFRKGGGRHFVRRIGSRNLPMSREEIFGQPAVAGGGSPVRDAVEKLAQAREELGRSGQTGLWLGLRPTRKIHLDVQDEGLVQIALDPSVTGNRRTGWHFARASHQPKLTKNAIEWGLRSPWRERFEMRVEIRESGTLLFWTSLESLGHSNAEERELWPLKLLEYPISAFRIARALYDHRLAPSDCVAADLALLGIGGWGLRQGSPGDYFLGEDLVRTEEPDLTWEPVVFTYQEIDETPDRCGFRLVRLVYQAFGWREEAMPKVFDPGTGRLVLPE